MLMNQMGFGWILGIPRDRMTGVFDPQMAFFFIGKMDENCD